MSDLVRQTLAAAGVITLGGGRYFKLIESGAAVNIVFVRGGHTKVANGVEAGYQLGPLPESERFDLVKITSTSGQTIAALIGEDFEDYDRVIGIFQRKQPSTVVDADDVDVGGSAAAVQVAAANSSRATITITNLDSSIANVRIGVAVTVAATRGQRLKPGQSVTLTATGAIHAIRETAAAASVCIVEENF